jgi:hypothetical protein
VPLLLSLKLNYLDDYVFWEAWWWWWLLQIWWGTFDHLSRAMTMHDKANFITIAPRIIIIFKIEKKLFELKF